MRTLYLLLFLVAGNLLSAQSAGTEQSLSVYFATASSELDAEAHRAITDFRSTLAAYADYDLRLEAFTDERGDTRYNEKLAAARAASVRAVLSEGGMTTSGWEVVSWGERRAQRGITDEEELRSDRRVDLVATVRPWTDMTEVLTTLRKDQVQTFTVDPTSDVTIRGERGGRFLVLAGSLVDENGEPAEGPVTVSLTEAYTLDDMLIAGLTTHSGERLLETGGMFNLTATDETGRPLTLATGRSVPASIPTADFDPDMLIFSGREHEEGQAPDWELTSGRVAASPAGLLTLMPGAPMPLQWEVDLDKQIASWLLQNPRPGETGLKKVNGLSRKPSFPDTASMVYRKTGLEKIFMSRSRADNYTREMRRRAASEYHINTKKWERRKENREKAIAHNLVRLEEIEAEVLAWQEKLEAFKEQQVGENQDINDKMRARFRERLQAWRAERQSKLETALTDNLGDARQGDLDRYFMGVSKMGWANCDIFWDVNDPVEALARVEGGKPGATVLLLPDVRRAVVGYKQVDRERWSCVGIAAGTGYELIAYQLNDGKIEYAQRRVDSADNNLVDLTFEPVSVEELKARLRRVRASK